MDVRPSNAGEMGKPYLCPTQPGTTNASMLCCMPIGMGMAVKIAWVRRYRQHINNCATAGQTKTFTIFVQIGGGQIGVDTKRANNYLQLQKPH